jgi:hypothetical protein
VPCLDYFVWDQSLSARGFVSATTTTAGSPVSARVDKRQVGESQGVAGRLPTGGIELLW